MLFNIPAVWQTEKAIAVNLFHNQTACPLASKLEGYSITLRMQDIGFLPNCPIVDDDAHLGVTPLDDRLRAAGTVEFEGEDRSLRDTRIAKLTRALQGLFPDIRIPHELSAWAGLRPRTPDGLPIIHRTPFAGLYVNSGHGALGWTLACGSADLILKLVKDGDMSNASPFGLRRHFW